MKNKILVASLLVVGLTLANATYAIGQNNLGQGGESNGIHEPGTGLENPELREAVQGTGQGLQVENTVTSQTVTNEIVPVQQKTQLRLQDGSGDGVQLQNQGVQNQNQVNTTTGSQIRSQVANAVQEMLQIADRNGGLGEQVRVVAQAQNQNREKIESSLQKIEARSKFSKFFVGPNYKEINSARKILEQNREQINQLNQVQNQLVNLGDAQKLTEQVRLLEKTNLEIENSLNSSEKGFSLLGWMFKLFSK